MNADQGRMQEPQGRIKWDYFQDASRNGDQYIYERLLIQEFLLNSDDLNIPL